MTQIVAHRGAIAFARENTIASFAKAISLGCYSIELDVRLSKDGIPIVFHDATTKRITGKRHYLEKLTLDQIKKLDSQIPTLSEAIDFCKNKVHMHIELKGEGTARAVYDLIKKNKIQAQVTIISYKKYLLDQIKELDPNIELGLLYDKRMDNIFEYAKGCNFICPPHRFITKEYVRQAKENGFKIYTYTIKKLKDGNKMRKFGVDQISADIPELLI